MVKVKKYGHYFYISGCQETGNYSVHEYIDGVITSFEANVHRNKNNGLKEARTLIAKHLMENRYPPEYVIPHLCNKPGREKDVPEKWNASKYYEFLKS